MHLYCIWLVVFWAVGVRVNLAFASPIPAIQKPQSTALSTTDQIGAAYFWPLVGLNPDASIPWGLSVSVLTGPQSFSSIYKLIIGGSHSNSDAGQETPASSSTESPQVTAVSTILQQDNGEVDAISIINDGIPQLVLGPDTSYPDANSSASVATVPFGINLGQAGVWNGSLTLSGTFDVNRIASTRWSRLPVPGSGDYFTSDEQSSVPGLVQLQGSSAETQFQFDFNSEGIILPASESDLDGENNPVCGKDMTLVMNGGETTILLPGNVTSPPDRCFDGNTTGSLSHTIILGRPFLQAAYAYFDQDGSVWVTQANQYNLPVNPQPFSSDAALAPPPPPTAWSLAHPDWHNYLKTTSGITQYIACLAGFGLLMFIFVSLCNGLLL